MAGSPGRALPLVAGKCEGGAGHQIISKVTEAIKMTSAQDSRYCQKDTSDQNFDYIFKLLIIGNSSVGKTSFLFRYADDSFTSAFVSTVGIDFKVKTVFKNEKRIKLQIWGDTHLKEGRIAERLTMWDVELKLQVFAVFLGCLKILSHVSFVRYL
ncbi:ras-related protein rab-3c [Limosa lapponica baueri]|uniref:small monomeric GTPase n=1 Tax=Limosa lapponica baueri TaxID=1758121 RepID=A0A2I0TBB8_LIMLA|nr:ras-related protein rab-3c [Limosa lapponica baueri]